MSAAAPARAATAEPDPPLDVQPVKPGNKKKLIVIGAALALLLSAAGGGAWFFLKQRAASAAAAAAAAAAGDGEAEGEEAAEEKPADEAKAQKATLKNAPTFVPLDPFTVNLADREAERYAQVGISLELVDAKAGDLLKAYMPAIRNNILLTLGSKTAAQLNERDGKLRLAAEIRREALRPLGYEVSLPAAGGAGKAPRAADDEDETVPIRAVHFSNFIIQ